MRTPIYYKNLLEIPDGLYQWKQKTKWLWFFEKWKYYGWLAVETSKHGKEFMWTSHKTTHDPFSGKPARNLTVEIPSGKVLFYMESALSFWIKWSVYKDDDKYLPALKEYVQQIEHFTSLHQGP